MRHDLIQLAHDLQTNEKFQSVLKSYQTPIEQPSDVPLSSVDAGTTQLDNQGDIARDNNKLRTPVSLADGSCVQRIADAIDPRCRPC